METSKNSGQIILGAVLVLLAGVYTFLFLQGLPYEQEAGLIFWVKAVDTPWRELLGNLFSPISEQLTADNVILLKVRVTESIVLKGLYGLFGDSIHVATFYNVVLGMLLAFLIYHFSYRLTQNAWVSFIIPIFLFTTPAYSWALMEYGDYTPLDQILLLIYLESIISYLFTNAEKSRFHRFIHLGVILLTGILTVRAKEPNLFLVPVLSGAALFWSALKGKIKLLSFKITSLIGVLAWLTLPILLVRHKPAASSFLRPEFFLNQFYIFFYNPAPYAGEKICPLFHLGHLGHAYPSTVFGNFGFFISWLILLGLVFILIRFLTGKCSKLFNSDVQSTILFILVIWTALSSCFNGFFTSFYYTRYLIWVLLPFSILVAAEFLCLHSLNSGRTRSLTKFIFLGFLILAMVSNLGHAFYMRKGLERIWTPKWLFRTIVYEQETGKKTLGLFEISRFWYPISDFLESTEHLLVHHVETPFLMEREPKDDDEAKRDKEVTKYLEITVSQFRIAYLATNVASLPISYHYELLAQVDSKDLSWLTAFRSRFSKKKPPVYYLYRVTP